MRQPVASILMLTEAALSEASDQSAVRVRLGHIREQAEWLGDLLQHLLEPADERSADGKSHNLSRIALDAVEAEEATYAGDLCLKCSQGNMAVQGNEIKLRRAISNLLSNATKAAGPEGRVVVELHRADDRVLLMIDDSGPGFGRIRRGTGLGLGTVVGTLNSYGGEIEYSHSRIGGARAILMLRAANS